MTRNTTTTLIRVGSAKRLTRTSTQGSIPEPLNPVERFA